MDASGATRPLPAAAPIPLSTLVSTCQEVLSSKAAAFLEVLLLQHLLRQQALLLTRQCC